MIVFLENMIDENMTVCKIGSSQSVITCYHLIWERRVSILFLITWHNANRCYTGSRLFNVSLFYLSLYFNALFHAMHDSTE